MEGQENNNTCEATVKARGGGTCTRKAVGVGTGSGQRLCGIHLRADDERARVECPICLEPARSGAAHTGRTARVEVGSCTHAFHAVCLDTWVARGAGTCPVCRARLDPGDVARVIALARGFGGRGGAHLSARLDAVWSACPQFSQLDRWPIGCVAMLTTEGVAAALAIDDAQFAALLNAAYIVPCWEVFREYVSLFL